MKNLVIAGLMSAAVCVSARADSDAVSAPTTTPVLSGSYIYNWSESCVNSATTSFMSGTMTFNAKTKVAKLNAYLTTGNPTISLVQRTGSATYSNTSTTVTVTSGAGPVTYQATYGGMLTGGIASKVSWIAVVLNGSCADMAWLTRQ